MTHQPIVILGGLGKVGRRLEPVLRDGGHPVRVASRSSEQRFDWHDSRTWAPALDGARAAYVVYLQNLFSPQAAERLRSLGELAVSLGVERLVLQSARGWPEAAPAEEALRSSGAAWTILRPAWFSQNFSEALLLYPLLAGEVRLPTGDGREAFVDAQDVAEVAAAVLTRDGHIGRVLELTGPRLMTFGDAVAEIAGHTGRDFRFTAQDPEAFAAELLAAGVPELYAYMDTEEFTRMESGLFAHVRSGANGYLTDAVERVLGRAPRDFADYVKETAATGVWDAQP
ncbi:NAD(P)H-binding protein [Streptomyces sp. L500]